MAVGRVFVILAFVAALGVVIPVVNAISPFSTVYKSPAGPTSVVTAGSSPWTYTDNTNSWLTMMIKTPNGITAETCNGAAPYQITKGSVCGLGPKQTMIVTWVTSAPVYNQTILPANNQYQLAQQAGCDNINLATGNITCKASVSGSSSGGFIGTIANTIFVFGNFFAALTFLANLALGVLVPGQYVFQWLYAVFGDYGDAFLIAAVFQTLVWVAYAYDFFYIVSGRWIGGT